MGSNPINLALRFLLEIVGLIALGSFGWHFGGELSRYGFAIGIPLVAAIIWGTFAVIDDLSRSGNAVVVISGMFRLAIEFTFFAAATWSMIAVDATKYGMIYGLLVLLHYVASYDRVLWLIRQ